MARYTRTGKWEYTRLGDQGWSVMASNTQIGYSKKILDRSFSNHNSFENVTFADTMVNINTLLTLWMGQLDYQHPENREI